MTDEELRKIDALVAVKVLGRRIAPEDAPEYSIDIAAAWEVVEKLDGPFQLSRLGSQWQCIAGRGDRTGFQVTADTAPLAICLAAMEAHK